MNTQPHPPVRIGIVGAGPRGVGVCERIAASIPELLPGRTVEIHLVDPFPAGGGRIWREEQSPLLALNSMAADVAIFTDDSVTCTGPIRPGASFWEWAQQLGSGELAGWPADLVAELRALTAASFPSRRLGNRYLRWVFTEVLDRLPAGTTVRVHPAQATGLSERDGGQVIEIEGEPPLVVDAVVLASGHLDAAPTADEEELLATARAAGLRYLPPEQTADTDLSVVEPGETVLVRGLGLAFVDLVVLLYEGRGGRFVKDAERAGGLRYLPSGNEPFLVAGSPRGGIYHAKTEYQLRAGRPPTPRHLTPEAIAGLGTPIDLREQLWPLMAKEIAFGWYHELLLGHPDRAGLEWPEFLARYDSLAWGTPEMEALLAAAAPDPADRIDFAALDRPFEGMRAGSLAELQPLVRARIADDLGQHVDPRHTPHLGAFTAMLSVQAELAQATGLLSARSRADDLRWWRGFFNSVASGPPGFRLRQVLALSEAGFVQFIGPGLKVDVDQAGHRFVATSDALPEAVRSTILIDARLQEPSVVRTRDPLLGSLAAKGEVSEELLGDDEPAAGPGPVGEHGTGLIRVRPTDGALVESSGRIHPRRFAIGPHTAVKIAGFSRPAMNAIGLRYTDAVARAVLAAVSA